MTDDRDFLERATSLNKQIQGREIGADHVASAFSLYGLERRAVALEALDAELAGDKDLSLRRRAELLTLRRKMGDIHTSLRRAGR